MSRPLLKTADLLLQERLPKTEASVLPEDLELEETRLRFGEGEDVMPFAKGDVAIDAVPTSADIDRALAKLETVAKERGFAVGTASALPISIDRLSAWIKTLDARGVMLVPLTTVMLKSKSG